MDILKFIGIFSCVILLMSGILNLFDIVTNKANAFIGIMVWSIISILNVTIGDYSGLLLSVPMILWKIYMFISSEDNDDDDDSKKKKKTKPVIKEEKKLIGDLVFQGF